jgi:hypothetical protein
LVPYFIRFNENYIKNGSLFKEADFSEAFE